MADAASATRRDGPVARIISALLAVVGLCDAIYLTTVKWNLLANPTYDGGICGLGGGCHELQQSAMAEIPLGSGPGLPISLLAVGFYLVWLMLLFMRVRMTRSPHDTRGPVLGRVMLGLALVSNLYSLVLVSYALAVGQFCPLCAILYGVNLGLAIVTALTLGESLATFAKRALSAIPTAVSGVAAIAFLLVVGASFFVYRTTLASAPVVKPPDPMANPSAVVHKFDTAGRAERGPADARIRIVEFADFECPHCRVLFHTLEEVVAKYPDDVHLSFLDFPLDKACNRAVTMDFHQRACDFATIAECARRQGRFFEAAGVLFDNGDSERPALLDKVVAVGVERAALDQCLTDPTAVEAIKGDIEQGITAGIQGTPAVYMNGVEVGGARPREFFEAIIDKHLSSPAPKP